MRPRRPKADYAETTPFAATSSAAIVSWMTIPTDEDFARARNRMAAVDADWDQMTAEALQRLRQIADLHYFALFPRDLCSFAGVLFFQTERSLAEAVAGGFDEVARSCIQAAVSQFRSGHCAEYDIHVEMDSYENVKRNYGGSYFNRLR